MLCLHNISTESYARILYLTIISQFLTQLKRLMLNKHLTLLKKMLDFWNARYKDTDYAYGKEPTVFFKEQLNAIPTHLNLLFPAEGEGRNAVYAATKGHRVTAFDISKEGRNKALALATEHHVTLDYKVGELSDLDFEKSSFDGIVLIYAHIPLSLKSDFYNELLTLLKPGGFIILEGFSKKHLQFNTENPKAGGPKDIDQLFSKDEILNDFAGFETLLLEETETTLNEGAFHVGKSAVIRYIGKKTT